MILELGSGVESVSQEPSEITLAALTSTFDYVRRDRHGSANELTPERRIPRTLNRASIAMNVDRESVRLPPYFELPIIPHAG